jgi:hypothetical protein
LQWQWGKGANFSCDTDDTGSCSMQGLLGGSTSITVTPAGGGFPVTTPQVTLTTDPTDLAVQLIYGATFSGVVTDSSGDPVSGTSIGLSSNAGEVQVTTGSDGSFSVSVPPGDYELNLDDPSFGDGGELTAGSTSNISVSGDTVDDITLPETAQLDVSVTDADDNPVPGAQVGAGRGWLLVDSTQQLQWQWGKGANFSCDTDDTGSCSMQGLLGGSTSIVTSLPSVFPETTTVTLASNPTDLSVQFTYFAAVPSAGPVSGDVLIASPAGSALTGVSNKQVSAGTLPPGVSVLTGDLGYTVTGVTPDATTDVTLRLPPGSDPSGVYILEGTKYVSASKIASISGSKITLRLTDGAHDVIVEKVIPVHVELQGYYLAGRNGDVVASGGVPSLSGFSTPSSDPVSGIATTPDGRGWFAVTVDGLVHTAGDAVFRGDLLHPARGGEAVHVSDIVALVATADGAGYWLLGADGEVYPFGDATFHGDLLHLPGGKQVHVSDVVGMVAAPSGSGYLLIGADGGVFALGAVHFYGSLPGIGVKVDDIRGILPAPGETGYVLVGADGGAFVFGHGAPYKGSLPGEGIKVSDIVGLALTPDGEGYWMAGADGLVYPFGDATRFGAPAGLAKALPIAAIGGT